jgi:hypothetical protein
MFAQMLFKPEGSVIPPSSIGNYTGPPAGGAAGDMGRPGFGRGPMTGAGTPDSSLNSEFRARRENGDSSSKGIEGKWLMKDGNSDIKLEFKVEDSKLIGTIENTRMPGAIEFKEGKIEGDEISFSYVRQLGGRDFKINWTGTLSGSELKLKRGFEGDGLGGFGGDRMPGGGR